MKIAFVTGKLAKELVERHAREAGLGEGEYVVIALDAPVAALMSAEYIARELEARASELEGVDVIVIPGMAIGNAEVITRRLGITAYKGTRHAHGIPALVRALRRGARLSTTEPADAIVEAEARALVGEALARARERARVHGITAGTATFSGEYPALLAEVPGVDREGVSSAVEVSLRYAREGADVIVLGSSGGGPSPRTFAEATSRLLREGVAVGVDSPFVEDVEAALQAGAAVVVNPPRESIEGAAGRGAILVLPYAGSSRDPREICGALVEAARELSSRGVAKLLVDPILRPPLAGLARSIEAYACVKAAGLGALMGAGNVTELIDADSIGVNALLATIAVELGVEAILTTEASVKTRRSVSELRKAIDMAVAARELGAPPKDLGIDLLVAKSKRDPSRPPPLREGAVRAGRRRFGVDPLGYFRVYADHANGVLILEHYRYGSAEPDAVIYGETPEEVGLEAIGRGLVSSTDHALYLGIELARAHVALRTGKAYEQDSPPF
ncbi:MAG: dihydropteroate synthase-like protein [Desulfurococcaceae archaeon]